MASRDQDAWRGFRGTGWRDTIDVGRFIHDNVEPYEGGPDFLSGPTPRTERIWRHLQSMFVEERRRGIYDVDSHTPSTITSHAPGYIDKDHELIVGLQTSAPLRRAIMPNGASAWCGPASLRFHRLGAPKYAALGLPFPLADTPPPGTGTLDRVRSQFRDHGLAVY